MARAKRAWHFSLFAIRPVATGGGNHTLDNLLRRGVNSIPFMNVDNSTGEH